MGSESGGIWDGSRVVAGISLADLDQVVEAVVWEFLSHLLLDGLQFVVGEHLASGVDPYELEGSTLEFVTRVEEHNIFVLNVHNLEVSPLGSVESHVARSSVSVTVGFSILGGSHFINDLRVVHIQISIVLLGVVSSSADSVSLKDGVWVLVLFVPQSLEGWDVEVFHQLWSLAVFIWEVSAHGCTEQKYENSGLERFAHIKYY